LALAHPDSSIKSNCWDGTFNYQVATIALENDLVEIGLKASFNFHWETAGDIILDETGLDITDPGSGETYLFLAFAPSDCQENNGSWHCQKTNFADVGIDNTLFIGRWPSRDANFQIAMALVNTIEMTMDQHEILVKITKLDGSESVASTGFGLRYCNLSGRYGNTHFGYAKFPDSLKDRLLNP
jgi:hypothetical protein